MDALGQKFPEQIPSMKGRVASAIRDYVAEHLSLDPADIRVRLTNHGIDKEVLSEQETIEVKETRGQRLLGRVAFMVTMKQKGEKLSYRWITAKVQRGVAVVMAARPLKRHQVMEASDLMVETLYLTRKWRQYAIHPKDLVGKRVLHPFGQGTPITLDRVEEVPLILRGSEVRILVENGGLKIVTVGRAKEDGFFGRSIAVVNVASQKTVYGKVMDASTVKIRMR